MSSVRSFHSAVTILLFGAIFGMAHLCAWAQETTQERIAATARSPLIVDAIDESRLTTLKGNTHPLARPEFDLGTAPASLPMQRMLLVLKRSPEQESALRKLLDDQQDKSSPSYHKWLSPEQFGKQFGPTDSDIQVMTSWLQSHGFEVGATKGRTILEFSGSASQVREAFHTTIHKYLVNGEQHWANAKDPQIPTALSPAIAGVLTLHNFVSKPASHLVKEPVLAKVEKRSKPQVTFPAQNGQPAINTLAPQDYAAIYNIQPVYSTYTGAGVTIGVVGRSDLYLGYQDVLNFFSTIGYANGGLGGADLSISVDGPDPGESGGGDEAEATLDTTWSAAIAPGAAIDYVVSGSTNTTDGIDLSELYIVENNLADIMTESFGTCEYFATDARLAGINALAEQAAAQGITYFVSAGDSGAEGCDDPNNPPAKYPVSVNALASTPFNVAVGGTMFNESGDPSKYWGSNLPFVETALSYIPENVWNESSPTNGLWSGSGGASAGNLGDNLISPAGTTSGVPKPSWQSGTGLNIPADGVRDVPDVSLTAAEHDPYLLCLEGSCVPNSQGYIYVYFISGTSAAAPSFAGIMALIDQSQGGRQGQANYVLYPLAAAQAAQSIYPSQCNGSNTSTPPASTCIFNDVTVGNNVVPGESGSDYHAGPGYDLTTGLGSVNVANLVSNWAAATFKPTTTAFTLNGGTTAVTISHGQTVAVGASVTHSGTTPLTGNVILYTNEIGAPSTMDLLHLSSGQASGSTDVLPGSNGSPYKVWAHYSGDGTYAPSNSNQITVTVSPEPSTTTLSLQGTDLNGNPVANPYPFGSLVFVRADVAGNSGHGVPTGTVNFSDTFGPLPQVNPQVNPPVQVISNPSLNSQGNTSIGDAIISFDAGNHSISASYGGDSSFNSSSSATPVNFSIQPGFAIVSAPTAVSIAAPGGRGKVSVGIITSTGFSSSINFTCGNLPSEAGCSTASATGQGPNTVVSTTIYVTTTAPTTTTLNSTQHGRYYAVLLAAGLPLMGIFFVAAPRRRRPGIACALMVFALLVVMPACGGGGGGSSSTPPPKQDPGTPAGTYTVTVTGTAGTMAQSAQFTLVVK